MLEGPTKVKRYLIVDDFMSSGGTYEAIREAVAYEHPHAECIGMLEVAYCENGGYDKRYRFSNEHQRDIERHSRIMRGKATAEDVEWITRAQPLPPNVIYRTVGIIREGKKYKFDFEDNRQKLLPATTDVPRDFMSILGELQMRMMDAWKPFTIPTEKPTETVVKTEPEVDGVDIYRNLGSNFFSYPMKYRFTTRASDPVGV
jgi:hypothetical protein